MTDKEKNNTQAAEGKRSWEPITVKIYHAHDAKGGAGVVPEGCFCSSNFS